jgi:dTDP-6-deoxy-L-talose 4-dehydrogenase (NAD+)
MSGGEQLRDYLPVGEAAKHLVSLAVGSKDNGIVNICSGEPVSVRSLVEGWIKDNGWSIKLNLGVYPYPDYEPMAFWGDRQKLDRCLRSE